MHEAQARIGLDAAEFDPLDAGRLERGGDAVIKAARLDAAAAEMQQRLLAVCRRVLADLGLGTATKNDAGGIAEFKIVHASILLCLLPFNVRHTLGRLARDSIFFQTMPNSAASACFITATGASTPVHRLNAMAPW